MHVLGKIVKPYAAKESIKLEMMRRYEEEPGDYINEKIDFVEKVVYKNYEEAVVFIDSHDKEYRNWAVPYLEKDNTKWWVAKYEFHC